MAVDFKITGVSRDDLIELFPERKHEIEQLADFKMELLAGEMRDLYFCFCFWHALRKLGEETLDRHKSVAKYL